MNTWRVAWRNLWRNRRRTAITVISIAISTFSLVVLFSLMFGMVDQLVRNATELGVGQVQVHAPEYLTEPTIDKSVREPQAIVDWADARGIPAAPRSMGVGLLAKDAQSSGIQFWGVDAARERSVGKLADHLAQGTFVTHGPAKSIVIGSKLARALDAQLGTELVALVQARDGSLGNALFRVTGILKSVSEGFDGGVALISREDFSELFVTGDAVHELVFSSGGRVATDEVERLVDAAARGNDVQSWQTIVPMLADFVVLFNRVNFLISCIFFIAAGLGVLNTMLMASYERIPEFGLIRALGASPWRVVREVAAEAALLGALGSAVGGLLGLARCLRLESNGIDLSQVGNSLSMSGVALDPVWRALVTPTSVLFPIVSMCVICVIAAVHPALKAARLSPLQSLNHV